LILIYQFTLCKENFLSIEKVGTEEISVREVVRKLFFLLSDKDSENATVQRVYHEDVCKSADLLCNLKCHNSQPCCNK
jgi:hypothetical protein